MTDTPPRRASALRLTSLRRAALLAALLAAPSALADDTTADRPVYGERLEGFDYPYEVREFDLDSQGQSLAMAYMDLAPSGPANGRTIVLMHGKNFCGATWEGTIAVLAEAGFRVVVPDQIGFCKSSKPRGYQFSFGQLASNTHALLASLDIDRAVVAGHSMGGMLAARYALSYPEAVERLVLINPIGLEDWQAEGVPYATIDQLYQGELRTNYDSIRNYQLRVYYDGNWRPDYDRWVEMQAGLYAGPGRAIVAWNQAQTSEMLFTQPVVHEFGRIAAPTLLLIGALDSTAPGAARAPEDVAARLGDYPALARAAEGAIPDARLVEFPDLGHSPQIEAPDRFHTALLDGLAMDAPGPE